MQNHTKQMENLQTALHLTQQPSTENFQKAEQMLINARQDPDYFSYLLHIIQQASTAPNIKLAAACCLAKDLKTFLDSLNIASSGPLIAKVLHFYQSSIFQIIAQNVCNLPVCAKLEDTLKLVVHKVYPLHWGQLSDMLLPVIKDSGDFNEIYSALKGVFYMLSKYKNVIGDKREPLKFVSKQALPYVENLAIKLLNQIRVGAQVSPEVQRIVIRILNVILKCFRAVNYLKIEAEYFNDENSKIWLLCFVQSFQLGNALSSAGQMSNQWDLILRNEERPSTKLMTNSLGCLIILVQQFKHNFADLGTLWAAFCAASKVIFNNSLQYLNGFKDVYLSAHLRESSMSLPFKSPWVSGLIFR